MTYGPKPASRFLLDCRLELKSVHIWEAPSRRRIFSDVERALPFLIKSWPTEFRDTEKHRDAVLQCMRALKSAAPGEFRIAFIVAAAEAGILALGAAVYDCLPEDSYSSPVKLAAE